MSRSLWILLGITVVLGSVVSALTISFAGKPAPVAENDPFPEKVFLPAVGSSSTLPAQILDPATKAGWQTFASGYWRLSFQYPDDWVVEEPDPATFSQPGDDPDVKAYGYGLRIKPAATKSYIGFGNDSIELSPDQDLTDWVFKITKLHGLIMDSGERTFTDNHTLVLTTATGQTRELFLGTLKIVWGNGTYFNRVACFANGRIVYWIAAPDSAQFSVVEEIAKSVRFAPDAPATLDQLYGEVGVQQPTVEQQIEMWTPPTPDPNYCDLPCRDRKTAEELGIEIE